MANSPRTSAVPPAGPCSEVTAQIGGASVTPDYAGAAPGLVAGVLQVNIKIPATVASGNQTLVITVGSATSQSALTRWPSNKNGRVKDAKKRKGPKKIEWLLRSLRETLGRFPLQCPFCAESQRLLSRV